ncbi:hypothetical protein ACIBCR_14935 [Micromonospora echinospora]|uniref:hypothetical protein n=1 Tax=Micromonospora echinospora TaxID=1877 RepID=UPI0037B5276D
MTTDTPGVDLDAIRRIEQAATDGPWTLTDHPNDQTLHITADTGDDDGPALIAVLPIHPDDEPDLVRADGALIARSRTDLPALLDIAEAARYVVGAQPCVEGECEHAQEADENAPDDTPCPLLETRYATAGDAIERDELRAEMELYRDAVLHMLALAPDEYRQSITAARASGSSEGYAKNNGRAEMIRVFATGLAERAGLPVADWEQIKRGIPADGVYRAEAVNR